MKVATVRSLAGAPLSARGPGLWIVAGVLTGCVLSTPAAAAPAKALNPPPTARDWADLAKLPDWSGVWFPTPFTQVKQPDPAWRPEVARQLAVQEAEDKAGRPRNFYVNCLPEGMPSFILMTLATTEFLFTPGRITILNEFDGNRQRRIYTDGRPHPDDPDLTFNGHSVGHWEGSTLVVDTVGILPETYLPLGQSVGIPNNGDMHLVERIALAGADTLKDEMEIVAPHVLTAPWKVSRTFTRNRERRSDIVEASCRQGDFHEGKDASGNAVFVPLAHADSGAPIPGEQ